MATVQSTPKPEETDPVLRWHAGTGPSRQQSSQTKPAVGSVVPADSKVRRESLAPEMERLAANRANAQHSTGPRTEAGKKRSSQNALTHGLTAASPVLPTEDRAAYDQHCRQFRDQYKPADPTESHLVQELIDTSWRLNRVPLLEAGALARALPPADPEQEVTFDIVDAHKILASLGLHSGRLSRQFQKALTQLRDLQEERRLKERRQLVEAAEILLRHECKGLPYNPADDGFVFSMQQIQLEARRILRRSPGFYRSHPTCQKTQPAYPGEFHDIAAAVAAVR